MELLTALRNAVIYSDQKIKKVMPIDAEPTRLIDWMEKGAYDALVKKSNGAADVTENQMRISVCKMVLTPIQLMRTLDKMPQERIVLLKLRYCDDVKPTDYELPFFRSCSEQEANTQCSKNYLKMDVGDVNSKHLILALNVKSILDPCGEARKYVQEKGMVNLGEDSVERDDSLDTDMEVNHSSQDHFFVAPVGKENSIGEHDMVHEDETRDAVEDVRQLTVVKNWINVHDSVELTDIPSNSSHNSMTLTEEIMAKLVSEGVISRAGGDTYAIRNIRDVDSYLRDVKEEKNAQETPDFKMMKKDEDDMKALYHALPMDYVTVPKLHTKLNGEAKQATVRKLIDQMAQEGYLEGKNTRQLGKHIVHSDLTAKKLLEDMEIEEPHNRPSGLDHFKKRSNDRDTSTCGGLHSIGSNLTRTQGKSHIQHNDSVRSEQAKGMEQEQGSMPNSKSELAPSRENTAPGNERTYSDGGNTGCSTQDKGARKAIMVKEPILQNSKRQKSQAGTMD